MGNRFKIPFELGTWAGLVAFAYFMIIWFTPFSPLGFARLGGFWIPILFVFMAVKRQKDAFVEEGLSFRNAFMTGITTVIVLGALKGALVYLIIAYVDINLVDNTALENIRLLEYLNRFNPQSDIDKSIQVLRDSIGGFNSFEVAFDEINKYFLGGIPVSLLAALIYNRKPQNV